MPAARRRTSPAGAAPRAPEAFPVVGVGASAGGLDAFRKLLDAMPPDSGMAFILVQHLDPTHESLMVDLLARHTPMPVRQAAEGMRLAPDCVYVIPPGAYLSVRDGALRLSRPRERHGTRLPFDFLLRSMADELGERAACAVLSGTGADGSVGLRIVKERCGLVVAQDPGEAAYEGMPRSAIATGAVDLVLPVARIPDALVNYRRRMASLRAQGGSAPKDAAQDWLAQAIDLLRTKTSHDFTLYKPGTLKRRIERRMAMAAIDADDMGRYLETLRGDPAQLDLLAKDLLINVTSFFRDPTVFDFLAKEVAPELIRSRSAHNPLRIWIAGCSTGEEAYSFAMIFLEQIAAARRSVKLQIFASDVDPDAVAGAREGLYSRAIEADVSPERLARFFTVEDRGYRVSEALRAAVVFTVQDVLSDPPFSRLDLISCRNLLIYLRPEAQAKVLSLFHFALREGGLLLLGGSESAGADDDRFEAVSKQQRLYRRIGRSRPAGLEPSPGGGGLARLLRTDQGQSPSRQAALAELCRRLVLEEHAPAAALIDRKRECLHSLGPTDRYLRVAPGRPTSDIVALAREGVRSKLRSAIQQAVQQNARVSVGGGLIGRGDDRLSFRIDVRPVVGQDEDLLLVCFVEERDARGRPAGSRQASRVAELEAELEVTRTELEGTVRDLESSTDAQKAIAEEALSVTEEFQATNEELLTSKEELQSLNEELTALNGQLQEALERQRTTSNDLQNILYSTDVATLFLDADLNIRFYTPAIKALFHLIPGDLERPIEDLRSLVADDALTSDAGRVLKTHAAVDQEVEAPGGAWYIRRILPYRTQDNGVEGVVVTYTDITERKRAADALEAARRQAEQANAAKSRFLAAASHDLRQPLQTLALLQGIMAKTIKGENEQKLVARLGETAGAMTGMLNALLDLNQIEAGAVEARTVDFPVGDLLGKLKDEFAYSAEAKGLELRVAPCRLSIRSDPQLLEQMLRNLLSNALKYTESGKVLLGCRRRAGFLSIEVWDTGIGIPEEKLQAIFEEYYQIDNEARERSRGLGLGLAIVRRLADLLGHRMRASSRPGKGSTFGVEVALSAASAAARRGRARRHEPDETAGSASQPGAILIVEDDPEVRELLERAFADRGHRAVAARDGAAGLNLIAEERVRPDLILADYNLPGGMNGLQFAAKARERLNRRLPVVILTGDTSIGAARAIAERGCVALAKPVRLAELTRLVERLLSSSTSSAFDAGRTGAAGTSSPAVVYVVDDDSHTLAEIRSAIEDGGWPVEPYPTAEAFLEAYRPGREACLVIDAYLPSMSGLELLQRLRDADPRLTAIMITGGGDVHMAVAAMKAGAADFIEKPIAREELLECVGRALLRSSDAAKLLAWREDAAGRLARLTPREAEILDLILAGHPNKNIAADLGISQRTVENHRAAIMKKTGSKSLPALARLALAAAGGAEG